jgi:UDP-N-acetylmuramoyl-tripeptide--D-alanyl-D-alanine ligase
LTTLRMGCEKVAGLTAAAMSRANTIVFDLLVWGLATYRRCVLKRIMFVSVTGSCGKTMTKEIIDAVLSTQFTGQKNRDTRNTLREVIRTVLSVKSSDSYCVNELSIGMHLGRLTLDGPLKILQPTLGVVTNIGTDHLRTFGSQQGIAAEKRKLIASLPTHGTAVLNVDDPLVSEMAPQCAGRVVTYGTGPTAMVQGRNVTAIWPDRLSFVVHYGGESHAVHTQLCGTHWVHSVLAALAVGLSVGVPLRAGVEAVTAVPPFPGRMSPEELASGATLIRDDWKAPILSFGPALDFIARATARRKIVIVGTISDYSGASKTKYVQIARQARAIADYVFFVGRQAPHGLAAKRHPDDDSVQAFATVEQLVECLSALLQPGDLVLVKGSPTDHLDSIAGMLKAAQDHEPRDTTKLDRGTPGAVGVAAHASRRAPPQLVVGLGNPQAEYRNARHNIGHRVVEALSDRLGAQWRHEDSALVAHADVHGRPVVLVKLLASMNTCGAALKQLGARLELDPRSCILVHDDIDLPLGKVRERLKGSAGGHRGVLSIITTLQSEEFRRVKIGVGQPEDKRRTASFVLAAFSATEEPVIRDGAAEACSRVLRLLGEYPPRSGGENRSSSGYTV